VLGSHWQMLQHAIAVRQALQDNRTSANQQFSVPCPTFAETLIGEASQESRSTHTLPPEGAGPLGLHACAWLL
jgi:hypothetical protein